MARALLGSLTPHHSVSEDPCFRKASVFYLPLFTQVRGREILRSWTSSTAFSEVQLRGAERCSVRRVMSSSCSQPSPTKE
jgi:hypothetical protein